MGELSSGVFTVAASAAFLLYVGGALDAAWDGGAGWGPEGVKTASADGQLPVYPQVDTEPDFVAKFGTFGTGDDEFMNLAYVETNSTHLFVSQYGRHYVQIFHSDGTFAGVLGGHSPTDDAGGFNSPTGMVYNGTHLLVCDTKNLRVQVFDSSGRYVDHFGMDYEYDPDMDVLTRHDIAVAGSSIFVADTYAIRMYDSSGNYVKSFGDPRWGAGSFTHLSAIGSNSTHLFAADGWSDDILIFDSGGNYAAMFGGGGSGDGQFQVASDIVSVSEYLLVSDIARDDIQIFDSGGNYVAKFGGGGSGDGQFWFVTSLASNSSHLLALDDVRYDVQTFSLFETGLAPNAPPRLEPVGPLAVDEGTTLTFAASATDADAGQSLTYSVYGAPPGASISPDGGVFTWTPTESQGPGTYRVTVAVTDDGQYPRSDSETVTIVVREENQPPELTAIGPLSVDAGSTLIVVLHAIDNDLPGNALEYAANATFGAMHGDTFVWTPAPEDAGAHAVRFTVSDRGLADHEDVEIAVRPLITAPLLLAPIGTQNVDEGAELTLTARPTEDAYAGRGLAYSVRDAPPGASISPDGGVFTWTPTESQGPGTYRVTVTVTDGGPQSDSASFDIVVSETNQPPELGAIGPRHAVADSQLAIVLSATDPDVPADELEYLANATFGDIYGDTFVWTPAPEDAGTHAVRFTVSDRGLADHEDVEITVSLTPSAPPVLDFIVQQNVTEGETLTFNASATDENEWQSLTYSVQDAPPGASISPDGGVFTWTPTESQGPGTYRVTVTVTDDGSPPQSDSASFDIVVSETNQPPELTAIGPLSVVVGSTLTVALSATDPDVPADELEYLANATFGAIYGDTFVWTPAPEDAGARVVIFTVHDGSVAVHEDVAITVLPAPRPPP